MQRILYAQIPRKRGTYTCIHMYNIVHVHVRIILYIHVHVRTFFDHYTCTCTYMYILNVCIVPTISMCIWPLHAAFNFNIRTCAVKYRQSSPPFPSTRTIKSGGVAAVVTWVAYNLLTLGVRVTVLVLCVCVCVLPLFWLSTQCSVQLNIPLPLARND